MILVRREAFVTYLPSFISDLVRNKIFIIVNVLVIQLGKLQGIVRIELSVKLRATIFT